MSEPDNTSDLNWDETAGKFDLWLPHLEPVNNSLISPLNITKDDLVLDIACGTGEPSLSIAKQFNVKVEGIDASLEMINVARKKACQKKLLNVQFSQMPAEHLVFKDNTFDKIVCRFGVMLFDDPTTGLSECARTLRPGGKLSIAVWGKPMTNLQWVYDAFLHKIPESLYPPLKKATSLGNPKTLHFVLESAQFININIKRYSFNFHFDSFENYWALLLDSGVLTQQLEKLNKNQKEGIRKILESMAQSYIDKKGLSIPHTYFTAIATKPVNRTTI